MYISQLNIQNWRSYRDVTFQFKEPIPGKPLVLIGAMNGGGKTSFLMALYLGLFGRYGLKFVENHKSFLEKEDKVYYRSAIESFRKRDADTDEPTLIDITISPTEKERNEGIKEVRIVRRWFFNSSSKLRQGSGYEEVKVYRDGNLPESPNHENGADHELIQNWLFRSDIVPAFFFDGEQAQSVINAAGNLKVQNAIDILFGTHVLKKSVNRLKNYTDSLIQKTGGKRNIDERKTKHNQELVRLGLCREELESTKDQMYELQKEFKVLQEKLEVLRNRIHDHGGDHKPRMESITTEIKDRSSNCDSAKNYIYSEISNIALEMALSRFREKIADRIEMENERDKWDSIRIGTEYKLYGIIQKALPEPHYHDVLLCDIDQEKWEKLRDRFKSAVESIYNPPPDNCADSFLFVFLNNKDRVVLSNRLKSQAPSVTIIQHKANEIISSLHAIKDLLSERSVLEANCDNIQDIIAEYDKCYSDKGICEGKINILKTTINTLETEEVKLKQEIELYREFQKQTRNSTNLLSVAESASVVIEKWLDELLPNTLSKIIDLTTKKFTTIADPRFRNGHIHIEKASNTEVKPLFINKNGEYEYFENMAGFERRSFGIAFSLALTELTNYRAPLVIDTPLGNADSEYRFRLLDALANANLDQIILLSHDQEITEDLHNQVLSSKIKLEDGTYFLIEYDDERNESNVLSDHYFF